MQYSDQPFVVHRTLHIGSTDTANVAQRKDELKPLKWSWEVEHEDRRKEAKADAAVHGAAPFQIDRKLLRDIVQEKMAAEVVRIQFLGAGESIVYCVR